MTKWMLIGYLQIGYSFWLTARQHGLRPHFWKRALLATVVLDPVGCCALQTSERNSSAYDGAKSLPMLTSGYWNDSPTNSSLFFQRASAFLGSSA
jgi:hypothetical protein